MKKMVMAALFGTALALGAGNAHAGGFLADLARPFVGDEFADAADDWHARAGRPLDRGFAQGLDTVAPGLGTAWTVQDEAKRLGLWPRFSGSSAQGGMQMGNRCQTAYGISHPGPLNPIGTPCNVFGDPGYVVF